MPGNIHHALIPIYDVRNEQISRLQVENGARVVKTAMLRSATYEYIMGLPRCHRNNTFAGNGFPRKRTGGLGPTLAIDSDCVVCWRRSEAVAVIARADVLVRSW